MKHSNFLFVFTAMLSLGLVAVAQQPKPGTTPVAKQWPTVKAASVSNKDNDEQQKGLNKKDGKAELSPSQLRGLGLVSEVAFEAPKLSDKRSSSLILAKAADLLWGHEKERAKELFASAFEIGADYLGSKDNNQEQAGKNSYVKRADVLLEVIRLVNKHDPELARSYTDKYIEAKKQLQVAPTTNISANMNRSLGDNQDTAGGLWRVAISFLETDSKLSIEIAGRALAVALTSEAAFYLYKLAEQDRQLADRFYAQALNRVLNAAVPMLGQLGVLVDYPFGTGKIRYIDGTKNYAAQFAVASDSKFKPDPQLVQKFLAAAFSVLSRVASPSTMQEPDGLLRMNMAFYLAKYLKPKVAEFQPVLLDEWQAMTLRLTTSLEETVRLKLEASVARDSLPREQGQPSNPLEELNKALARAEKATDINQRDKLYVQAALSANQADDSDKALEIAGKIVDLSLRRRLVSWVSFSAAERAQTAGKWEEARRYAIQVEAIDERAYLLMQLSIALQKAKNVARATEILEEALSLARAAENTPSKFKALVGIANNFATTDFIRSYETLEVALKAANQLPPGISLAPDDIYLVRTLDLSRGSGITMKTIEDFDLGKALIKLAKHDTERGISLLPTLENLPLRYSATIALAGFLLQPSGK